MDVTALIEDLAQEHAALDLVVAEVAAEDWERPTPSPGWAVRDQIGHLAYFDRTATLAIVDPSAFEVVRDELFAAALGDPGAADRLTLGTARAMSAPELLAHWREGRGQLLAAAAGLGSSDRVVWYGPSMSARSFLTARLMETWAHGQDVADALGVRRPATERLFHVAQLGVITRGWSYLNRGEEPPPQEVFVELEAPSGAVRTWGDPAAADSVRGSLEEFCLVVTQRRHHSSTTGLVITGPAAHGWMERAQAFAGPPTKGPGPDPAN